MRHAAWALLLLVVSALAAAPARADHGGFHNGFHRPGAFERHERFEHREAFENRRFFHRHVFFHPFFFFGTTVFAPVPIVLFPPPVFPAYVVAPIGGVPYCYTYQTTIIVGGLLQPAFGTACLGADGYWHIG